VFSIQSWETWQATRFCTHVQFFLTSFILEVHGVDAVYCHVSERHFLIVHSIYCLKTSIHRSSTQLWCCNNDRKSNASLLDTKVVYRPKPFPLLKEMFLGDTTLAVRVRTYPLKQGGIKYESNIAKYRKWLLVPAYRVTDFWPIINWFVLWTSPRGSIKEPKSSK